MLMLMQDARWPAGLMLTLIGMLSGAGIGVSGQDLSSASGQNSVHPLAETIAYLKSHSDYIRTHVSDYTCRLVKRERIQGELQARQFAHMMVRCEQPRGDGTITPLAVFMQFVAPQSIHDRRVLYVADQHDGKVLVRKGGRFVKFVKVRVDPFSDQAREESNKPITDVGFDRLIDGLIQQALADTQRDPSAANTQVTIEPQVVINDRPCTHVQIRHPRPVDGVQFSIASLYLDNELHVPVRFLSFGWPEHAGGEPPLNEEYNYIGLRLNVGLTDADFSETLLERSNGQAVAGQAGNTFFK